MKGKVFVLAAVGKLLMMQGKRKMGGKRKFWQEKVMFIKSWMVLGSWCAYGEKIHSLVWSNTHKGTKSIYFSCVYHQFIILLSSLSLTALRNLLCFYLILVSLKRAVLYVLEDHNKINWVGQCSWVRSSVTGLLYSSSEETLTHCIWAKQQLSLFKRMVAFPNNPLHHSFVVAFVCVRRWSVC